ncbi:MAG: cytochrome c maturation protein CcmE [Candidatus Oxydemutatoraceae bacterium WSBS_2016_MAG_OTU14]
MTQRQKHRLAFVLLLLTAFSVAAMLVVYALGQNLLYFYTPSQVAQGESPVQRDFNVGGLVVAGSVKHAGTEVQFDITDTQRIVTVVYNGILPDLFREGQGIVATGRAEGKVFRAARVLAKHDENYMPPEVAEMLKSHEPTSMKMSPKE